MNKNMRITDFAKELYENEKDAAKAGEIIEGIMEAKIAADQ